MTDDLLFHGAKEYPVCLFVVVVFFSVTVLCVSVARIRDGAGRGLLLFQLKKMSLEVGAFFGTSSTERRLGTVQKNVFDRIKGTIHCQSISAFSHSKHKQL